MPLRLRKRISIRFDRWIAVLFARRRRRLERGLAQASTVEAMARGEVFFIAIGEIDGKRAVLGFASDYRIEGSEHGASAYVRGRWRVAESGPRSCASRKRMPSLEELEVSGSRRRWLASSSTVRHGFVEIGRGETHLRSGRPIACVFMEKQLRDTTDA